jgi:ubiquinol-cytochrome c reductase cytochrome b subunit
MNQLWLWLDDRTGIKQLVHETLYENIPGGARWRYVWGSTLVFAFITQVVTGIFLWMCYSPSSRTAWESVYYIQYEMQFGWLLRGIHHFMAQMMVLLLAIHLLQVVIDGAYRAPREFNFWIGLILMKIVLGLSLTGYLLPWDQKGYWATAVATNLMGFVPLVGDQLQRVVVGGSQYGNHTLTRFFALHAGVLPGLLIALLAVHIALFRKHGIHTRPSNRPDQYFWPDQVLRDAVACLAVLAVVLLCCCGGFFTAPSGALPADYLGAELAAPADPSEQFSAARPEWYFLFLFQLLKYFTPETMGSALIGNEFVGAILVPGLIMGFLFLMPILGRWRLGHGFNVAFLFALLIGAGILTFKAKEADLYAQWYGARPPSNASDQELAAFEKQVRLSRDYLAAVEQGERDARRIVDVVRARGGVPFAGAIALMREDAEIQGPRLFAQSCASCHSYLDQAGQGIAGPAAPAEAGSPFAAPNLYGFASRRWLAELLHKDGFASARFFGGTGHAEGDMANFVGDQIANLDDEGKVQLVQLIAALSAEAKLRYQEEADAKDAADGSLDAGRGLLSAALSSPNASDSSSCTDCHKFRDQGDLGTAPDLTGYGSEEWLVGMISNPDHERFYSGSNDRMPAFAPDAQGDSPQNRLSPSQLRLLARWIRRDEQVGAGAGAAPADEAVR